VLSWQSGREEKILRVLYVGLPAYLYVIQAELPE
jgi:hypothetical protein